MPEVDSAAVEPQSLLHSLDLLDLLKWAPAVWVAVVGAVLLVALARWYDRVPAPVVAVYALALALFYGQVLAGGAVLLPLDNLRGHPPFLDLPPSQTAGNRLQSDLLYLVFPERRECRRATAAGEWPLLAPRIGTGLPLLADPQSQAFQPIVAVGEGWLAPTAGPGAVAALRTFLALVFTFLFLRRLGAGRGPALAGSLAFGLGGFLQLWLGWPVANTAALLPAVLYALVLADERGMRRDWALLVLALSALLVAGHPETEVYALAAVVAFGVARVLGRPRDRRRRWLVKAAGALALAGMLAAPALLSFGELLPHSLRWARLAEGRWAAGPGAGNRTGDRPARAPLTRLVQVAAPNALGNSRTEHYWGLRNTNEDAAGFVGTVTLLGALLAFPGWMSGSRPLRHEILGLVLAEAAALVLVVPPGFLGRVPEPGISGRVALLVDLGLVIAATGTFERARRGELPPWLRLVALPSLVLAFIAFHTWAYDAFPDPLDPRILDTLRRGWLLGHIGVAVLGALVLSAGAGRRWAGPALALVIGAELLAAHRGTNPPMPRALAFPRPAVVAALEDAEGGVTQRVRLVGTGRTLLPNLAAVYGLLDARAFSPMVPMPYVQLLEPAIARWRGESPLLDERDHPEIYDRLGVGWIVLPPGKPCPPGNARAFSDATGTLCRRPAAGSTLRAGDREPTTVSSSAGGAHWRGQFVRGTDGPLRAALVNVPGWRLLADGRPAPVAAATRAHPLVSASLPSSVHRIDLIYRPGGLVAGLPLAALGVALLMAWTLRPPRAPETPPRHPMKPRREPTNARARAPLPPRERRKRVGGSEG